MSGPNDAYVFQQLAAVLKHDRRTASPRQTVRHDLWIAAMPGRTIPSLDVFERVITCDISTTGVAFLAPNFVRSEIIAIRFRPPLGRVVVAAKVIYQSRVADSGPECIKVGCEFLRRL